ncbi:MAG: hypothetical protein V1847_01975 [Candidatus Diapherotrites archaeon]
MDLSPYLKRNDSAKYGKKGVFELKRSCLHCGGELNNKGTVLFGRGFCSEKCYDSYVNAR